MSRLVALLAVILLALPLGAQSPVPAAGTGSPKLQVSVQQFQLSNGLTVILHQDKTVPVAIVSEFVDGDIFRWGALMAGALVGSLPLVILYSFFVEHYVSSLTGAVKE